MSEQVDPKLEARRKKGEALRDANPRAILLILAIPAGIIGLIALAFMVLGIWEIVSVTQLIKRAETVTATIVDVRIETWNATTGLSDQRSTGARYRPVVEYTYSYQGETHTSTSLFPTDLSRRTRESAAKDVWLYRNNPRTSASVDPLNPSRSYLSLSQDLGPYASIAMGLSALALLAGLAILLIGYHNIRRTAWVAVTIHFCLALMFCGALFHLTFKTHTFPTTPIVIVGTVTGLLIQLPMLAYFRAKRMRRLLDEFLREEAR